MTRALGACLLATAAITACGGSGSDRPQAASTREPDEPAVTPAEPEAALPEIVVTGRRVPRSAACRPRETAAFVVRFLAAANRGDPRAADAFDPQAGPTSGWFSLTSNEGAPTAASVSVTDREGLAAYLAARHRENERLRLIELRVADSGALGHIEFALVRRADDLADGAPLRVEGKGAVNCERPALVAWSSSVVTPEESVGPVCPRPDRRAPGAVVACGRSPRAA